MEFYSKIVNLSGLCGLSESDLVGKTDQLMVFKDSLYGIAKKTIPVHSMNKITKKKQSGISKLKEYGLCQGCPVNIIGLFKKFLCVRSFHVDIENCHLIPVENITDYLEEAEIKNEEGENVIVTPCYPKNIPLKEIEVHVINAKRLQSEIEKMIKNPTCNPIVKKIIEDKLFQMVQTQGAPYDKMSDIEKYLNGEMILSKNERFGNSIFNRNSRYCPPVDISYEEFKKSASYPYPIGIRPKDFALPSDLVETLTELMTQIYNFENIDKTSFEPLNGVIALEERESHVCKYCGTKIDANLYSSTYASENNFIEICHRDPNGRFLKRNMYWGHGECNRRQGGYSEEERIKDGLRLLRINKEHRLNFQTELNSLNKSNFH